MYLLFCEAGFEFCLSGLIAGLAEKGKHILLVAFYAGLIEGVDSEEIAGNSAGLFEEVDKAAEVFLVGFIYRDNEVRNRSVGVSKNGSLEGLGVYEGKRLSCEEVESVAVVLFLFDTDVVSAFADGNYGFEHYSASVLNKLTHRVKIGREDHRRGEETLIVFSFAFAEELLIPLCHHRKARLVGDQHFDSLTLAVEGVTDSGIRITGIFVDIVYRVVGSSIGGTLHKGVDISSADGNGKKADGGKYREASSDVVGNYETFVALLIGKLL